MEENIPQVVSTPTETTEVTPAKNNNFLITLLSVLLLITVFIAGFFAYQTQNLVKEMVALRGTPEPRVSPTVEPTPDSSVPHVTTPSSNEIVVSPLVITGSVPQGWMFEGVFPIKIVDENKKIIKEGQGKEKIEGSWTTTKDIEFTSTIIFSTNSKKGFLILENDNPSGLAENKKSFEIPILFSNTEQDAVACTMEAKICPDGSAVGRSGPKCEFSPCPVTSPRP